MSETFNYILVCLIEHSPIFITLADQHFPESNLNLRIPGFSSDETRVSISQSAMVGDVLLGAVGASKPRPGGAAATSFGPGSATKAKGKASKEKGSSKESNVAEKEREAALGRGLRTARIAAVRTARKGS
jgi:hypothetical protein